MTCPNCGNKIAPGADVCDNCGYVVPASGVAAQGKAKATKGAVAVSAIPGTRICPNCGNTVAADADICDNCGMMLTPLAAPAKAAASAQTGNQSAAALSAANICPNCRKLVSPNDRFCRNCGFNFVSAGLRPPATAATGAQPVTAAAPVTLRVGSRLGDGGKYEITKQIGAGGMGAVFLANDTVLKRPVVIKALLAADDPDQVEQSVKEREFLASVKHANIVGIYDFITVGTEGYIVMEYVNGRTLMQLMEDANAPFSPDVAMGYILEILPAFAYLHKLDLVYCDFKPQNVMREKLKDGSEIVKLIDLGTVIHYEPNPASVYGTRGFYAPEAVEHPSPQTDLYTICRALAYMVSWFDLGNPEFGMPTPDQVPIFRTYPSLYRFLYKGTHPNPAKRFQSAEEMAAQLQGVRRISAGGPAGVPVTSAHFNLGTTGLLSTTGRLSALGAQSAIDERDKAADVLRQGDVALRQGSGTAALLLYKQAMQANPRSVDSRIRVIDVLLTDNKLVEAQAEVAEAQRIDPNNWKVAWAEGRVHEAVGDLAGARAIYENLTAELPGELPPLLSLARVDAAMGDTAQAAALYGMVAQADPANTEGAFGLASALAAQQQWDGAVKALSNVSPSSARFVDAQLELCDLLLHKKPQPTSGDLTLVANALQQVDALTDTPRYLLLRADFLRRTWEEARGKAIPLDLVLPGHNGTPAQPASQVGAKGIGAQAETAYREYLNRNPLDPNRDAIARRKFEVAPWRLA